MNGVDWMGSSRPAAPRPGQRPTCGTDDPEGRHGPAVTAEHERRRDRASSTTTAPRRPPSPATSRPHWGDRWRSSTPIGSKRPARRTPARARRRGRACRPREGESAGPARRRPGPRGRGSRSSSPPSTADLLVLPTQRSDGADEHDHQGEARHPRLGRLPPCDPPTAAATSGRQLRRTPRCTGRWPTSGGPLSSSDVTASTTATASPRGPPRQPRRRPR